MNSTAGETLFPPSTLVKKTVSVSKKPHDTRMNACTIWVPCSMLDPPLEGIEMGRGEGQHKLI